MNSHEPSAGSERILIAEDVQANIALFRAILERAGHTPDFVMDGQAAIEAAGEHPYPLILMDVGLPVLDGVQAARAIRASGGASSNTLIVALTAESDRAMERACAEAGMDEFMTKPISPSALIAKVAELIPVGKARLIGAAA
ncbi:MAG: response regulator [Neomegalonema sp.]|nr:response regulator [Neomegalonema sp.]